MDIRGEEHPLIYLIATLHSPNWAPLDSCPKPYGLYYSLHHHNDGTTIASCNEHKPSSLLGLNSICSF